MAGYAAVIDLRVNGLDGLRTVSDRIESINRLIKQIKPVPTLFDARGSRELKSAKQDLDLLVKKYADGGTQSARFASSVAGLNQQLTVFRTVAANAKTGSDQFTNALKAAEFASSRLAKAELERLNTLNTIYTRQGTGRLTAEDQGPSLLTKEVLTLGKTLPTSIAGLRSYGSELDRIFNLVEAGSVDFRALQAEIARVNRQLDIATGGGPIQGPELPPAMRGGRGGRRGQTSPIGGGPNFPGSPGARAAQMENLMLGAGFPLLFGGGAGQVAGGLLGSFVGTGFGGQILGSAIGQQLEDATRRITEIGTALNELNMDALRDSVILVNSELTNQVRLLQEAGKADEARALIAKEVTLQTGLLPETVSDITNNTNLLGNTWNEFAGAVSGTLAILGAPFVSALTFILQGLAKALQGINFIATGAASIVKSTIEWAAKTLGLGDLLNGVQNQMTAISEEEEKRVAALQQLTDGQLREIQNNQKNLRLEAQRTLGRTAAEKQINAEIDRQLANERIRIDYAEKAKQLREQYASVTSEAGQRELELALASNEALKQQALEQQKIKDLLTQQTIAAQALKEQQDRVTAGIQESITGIDKSAGVAAALLDRQVSVAQAYLNTERQITDVLIEQANRKLAGAKTYKERIAAARDIYSLTVKQAKLEYEANSAAIHAEVQKAQLATQTATQKFKQVEAAVYLAQAEGKVNEAHFKSLNATREALELSKIQADTTAQVAQQQERGARAALKGKMQAAEAAFLANVLSRNTNSAAQGAATFAANMQSGAAAAAAAAAAQSQGTIGSMYLGRKSVQTLTYTDEELFNLRLGKYADQGERERRTQRILAERRAGVADKVGGIPPGLTMFEDGSIGKPYKDGITDKGSMIPPGYVMFEDGSIGKPYKDGITDRGSWRGSGAGSMPDVEVNIKTGPVTQIEGKNYVTTQEMGKAVQAGVQQTLDIIMRDGNVRTQLGLA